MKRVGLLLFASGFGCVVLNPNYQDSESGSGGGDGTSGTPTSTTTAAPTTKASASMSGTATSMSADSSTTEDDLLGDVEFIDERWDGQFGEAEHNEGLEWAGDGVVLEPDNAGATLESRIYDAEGPVHWVVFQWDPHAPYQRPVDANPLPADAPEVTLLDDIVLLLHLDEPALTAGDAVSDAMGLRDGEWFGTPTNSVRGVFSRGLEHDDGGLGSRIDFDDAVEPGLGPFTWAMWYREAGCSGTTLLALDSPLPTGSTGTGLSFIGCGGGAICMNQAETGYAIARIQGPSASNLTRTCSSTFIDDGSWHHIVARRSIEGNGQRLDLFVDGQFQDTEIAPGIVDVSVNENADNPETFTVAGGNHSNFPGPGAYDEVALWNRALTDQEIEGLYLRGALVARFQVRACDEPNCEDAEFVGPGGSATEEFIDPGPKDDHAVDLEGLELHGRYFQYRFQLRRPEGVQSPAIAAVRALGFRD